VGAVWPLMLKIVHEMANVFVAKKLAIPIAQMGENLPLEYWGILVVAFRTQNF
jgi:hypothetical protein